MGGWETVKYNGWLPLLYEEIGARVCPALYGKVSKPLQPPLGFFSNGKEGKEVLDLLPPTPLFPIQAQVSLKRPRSIPPFCLSLSRERG